MTPWWWVSVLIVALPGYLALRHGRNIWIAMAACGVGLVLAALLEGMLFVADGLMSGKGVAFSDAVEKAAKFPTDLLIGLVFIVAGALNPERLFLVPRVVEDILEGSGGSALRALKISLRLFDLIATIAVPFVAAILGRRAVRWTVIGVGSLVVTAARIGAGYLHRKDQNIVVISGDPPWLSAIYDINMAIAALVQTFIQICLAYFILRALIYFIRQIWRLLTGSGRAGPSLTSDDPRRELREVR